MKVAVITLTDEKNYGNRLQNFAVIGLMKHLDIDVDTLDIELNEYRMLHPTGMGKLIRILIPRYIGARLYRQIQIIINRKLYKRMNNFREFNQKKLSFQTIYAKKYEDLCNAKFLQEYDYFLCGSDQVWNPYYVGGRWCDTFFLTFSPPEKRIACIASMGVSSFPDEQMERYRRLLNEMKYISVREEKAVEIIQELTGKRVDCFFDPVLLLGREEWEKVLEPVKADLPARYILSFFLGELPNEAVVEFARGKRLEIIYMNHPKYKKYYSVGPEQFLYIIRHAEYILTDSFHVAAFSVIFKKQFYVFRRKQRGKVDMFSRMESLLGKLELMDRIVDDGHFHEGMISRVHYEEIEKRLIAERTRFDAKMKEVLLSEE